MKAKQKQYAIGVDYGTNSVRALVVDLADGAELASVTFAYPSGEDGVLEHVHVEERGAAGTEEFGAGEERRRADDLGR